MKTLVITNDYPPKKGGISTYIKSFEDHLNFETVIYAPNWAEGDNCLLYTSPSPRDVEESRMPSSA